MHAQAPECSMLYEEPISSGASHYFRTAIKSLCPQPVVYAVAMFKVDWEINIDHVYKDFDLLECHDATDVSDAALGDEVTECLIRVTPEKPLTGWQLKPESYGIHWAHKVQDKAVTQPPPAAAAGNTISNNNMMIKM